MSYQRRIIDDALDELMPGLAAIALEGAKGVGKTATASQRARSVLDLSRADQREVLAADPDFATRLSPPTLIDEWQLVPDVWDRVRTAVDDDNTGGRFLLTGSAGVHPEARVHSGAGRIVSFTMRPMSLAERGLVKPTISLKELLSGTHPEIDGRSPLGLETYTDEILRSGFPGIRDLPEKARAIQLDSYITRIIDRDLPEYGIHVRRPEALRAWLAAYGAATSTNAEYSKILLAATAGEADKPARATVDGYREHLARVYLLDPIPPWIPAFNPLKRLTRTPKHHLVDPALAARLVGTGKEALLTGEGTRVGAHEGTWLGALFESLAAQSVRIYADAASAQTGHLRTKGGEHEIDLIVEGADHRIVAIEVKLGGTVSDGDVRHLNWLDREIGDRMADRMIVNTGEYAYRRSDGVAVVPLALLGP